MLEASRRKFEVLEEGEKETKVRFLDRAVHSVDVLSTDDLEAVSDYKRPLRENPEPPRENSPWEYYGGF